MNIILLDTHFNGAYGSIHIFLNEIAQALQDIGHHVYYSGSAYETVQLTQSLDIQFSLGIGQYNQFYMGVPVYDYLKLTHYQWVIDNPYKIETDCRSPYIFYIMIDEQFTKCTAPLAHPPLILPIGIPDKIQTVSGQKCKGIMFSGQIRDPNAIYEEIKISQYRDIIETIIEQVLSEMDKTFIDHLAETANHVSEKDKKTVFRLSNSYIRAYKRQSVISSIQTYPVFIAGSVFSKTVLAMSNVTCLGKMEYADACNALAKYRYSLHIEPNFQCGIHDRILRSAVQQSLVVTPYSQALFHAFHDSVIYYRYDSLDTLQTSIEKLDSDESRYEKMTTLAEERARKYSWEHVLSEILSFDQRRIPCSK